MNRSAAKGGPSLSIEAKLHEVLEDLSRFVFSAQSPSAHSDKAPVVLFSTFRRPSWHHWSEYASKSNKRMLLL